MLNAHFVTGIRLEIFLTSAMDIGQILENAILSPDPAKRADAERQLSDAANNHFVDYISLLTDVLANEEAKSEVRMLAGIGLKNQLTAKSVETKQNLHARWISLDPAAKSRIKETSIKALLSVVDGASRSAAQLVAAIADIELPRNEWPDLIPFMMENTKPDRPDHVKKASLLTIGYICETADPNNPAIINQANGILITIVQGAHSDENSGIVRLTALNALVNSLEFIKYNFEKEGERNYIMQVICEATQDDNSDLQATAFGCLARIMALYYKYMSVYMEKALYGLTVLGMQSADERVACMAVEFWSSVCEEELDFSVQRSEFGLEATLDLVNYNFALIALQDVLPTLLTLLTRQNEDPEDDDWSVAMAAGACLQLFAQNTGNYIVEPTLQFVEAHITSDNWRSREAAVMAFGSILEGPDLDQLTNVIIGALSLILPLIKDESLHVKETVAWCLGRIAEFVITGLDLNEQLPGILEALSHGLQDHPKVATNCCWTYMNLAEQLCTDGPEAPMTVMTPFAPVIIPLLMQLSKRPDNDYSARDAAFEALSSYVQTSGQDSIALIHQIAQDILSRLEQTIGQQHQPMEVKLDLEDVQISMLSLLTNIIRRLNEEVLQAADNLMEMFLKLLETIDPNALIEEDIFIAISAVASAVGPYFAKYMESFLPFLSKALTNTESPTAITAVGIVADLCHSLGDAILPYLEGLMTILGSNLNNTQVRRALRPAVLSCFGHVATTMGNNFEPFVEFVIQVCQVGSTIEPEDSSVETAEYIFDVKESVLDCYAGIVGGLQNNGQILYPYIGEIFLFLHHIVSDIDMSNMDSIAASVCGLIGDIGAMYPEGQFKQAYEQPWVTEFVKRTRANTSFSNSTRESARWARDQQKRQLQL